MSNYHNHTNRELTHLVETSSEASALERELADRLERALDEIDALTSYIHQYDTLTETLTNPGAPKHEQRQHP